MAESKKKIAEVNELIIEQKFSRYSLLTNIYGSMAYNWLKPAMKPRARIIAASLHSLTLVALTGAAAVEYYDLKSKARDLEESPSLKT